MPIIDFLMENLFIVMIVFFFLSSLIAKNKKGQSTANRNQGEQAPVRTGNVDTDIYDVKQQYEERTFDPMPRSTLNEMKSETIMELREKKDRLAKKDLKSPIYGEDLELSDAIKRADLTRSASRAYITLNNPTADEAVKGMVWAEIFGPPRAKKPFSGGSYRK